MPSPLRFVPDTAKLWTDKDGNPIAIAEVTIRTIQGRFLMRPSTRSRSLILGVLGKAQQKYKFPLYGYAYLSNQNRSHPISNPDRRVGDLVLFSAINRSSLGTDKRSGLFRRFPHPALMFIP